MINIIRKIVLVAIAIGVALVGAGSAMYEYRAAIDAALERAKEQTR